MKRRREEVLVNMTGTHEEKECDWVKEEEEEEGDPSQGDGNARGR